MFLSMLTITITCSSADSFKRTFGKVWYGCVPHGVRGNLLQKGRQLKIELSDLEVSREVLEVASAASAAPAAPVVLAFFCLDLREQLMRFLQPWRPLTVP